MPVTYMIDRPSVSGPAFWASRSRGARSCARAGDQGAEKARCHPGLERLDLAAPERAAPGRGGEDRRLPRRRFGACAIRDGAPVWLWQVFEVLAAIVQNRSPRGRRRWKSRTFDRPGAASRSACELGFRRSKGRPTSDALAGRGVKDPSPWRKRLPRVVFDYIDGGDEGEVTLQENCRAFEELSFRPRQAVAVPRCDLATRVLGLDLALPVLLAPVGYSRLMHPGGEVVAARAAGAAGTAYVLSTVSGHRMEDVKAASRGPVWYQLS